MNNTTKKIHLIAFFVLALAIAGCETWQTGADKKFTCFSELPDNFACEASAVSVHDLGNGNGEFLVTTVHDKQLDIASIKYNEDNTGAEIASTTILAHSSVFQSTGIWSATQQKFLIPSSQDYLDGGTPLLNSPFKRSIKFEAITQSDSCTIATTSFEKYAPNAAAVGLSTDYGSAVLSWPTTRPATVHVLSSTNAPHSFEYRDRLIAAIGNSAFEYVKVEGLTLVSARVAKRWRQQASHGELLFGIRSWGVNYENRQHVFGIIAVPVAISENCELTIQGDFELIYELDDFSNTPYSLREMNIPAGSEIAESVALSSLEYAPDRKGLWMTSSLEGEDSAEQTFFRGKLGLLKIQELPCGQGTLSRKIACDTPKPIKNAYNKDVLFEHKPEGLAIINRCALLVMHDDDRTLTNERNILKENVYNVVTTDRCAQN